MNDAWERDASERDASQRDASERDPSQRDASQRDPSGRDPSQWDPASETRRVSFRVPTSRPWLTYVLLGLIGAAFAGQTVLGGSTNSQALIRLGAQVNTLVAEGEYWRLLSAMFLHIGLSHILFNGWALFSLGREVEAFLGSFRFGLIYFVAGIAGNIAYYVGGREGLSAGASGAVFGIIGAEAAYFVMNRKLFGALGRQRLGNVAVLIAINLVFGFTVPGINNLAHLGGLVAGFLLGLALAPRYALQLGDPYGAGRDPEVGVPGVVNRRSIVLELAALLLMVAALGLGYRLGTDRWQGSATMLRTQAETAYEAGDLARAQDLLEAAIRVEPEDSTSLFNLGVIYLQQDRPDKAVDMLERARSASTASQEDGSLLFTLGIAYVAANEPAKGRPLLEQFLAREPAGERATYVRGVLDELQ